MTPQIAQLRKLAQSTNIFWYVVIYLFLTTITLTTFIEKPQLLQEPRGWGIIVLVAAFAAWYRVGRSWMMCDSPKSYYERLDSGEISGFNPRGLLYLLSMAAIVTGLAILSNNYVWMFWAIYGLNFSIFPFPQVLFTTIPTSIIIIIANGWQPKSIQSPADIVSLVSEIGGLTIYSFIAYLPFVLLKARFRREQVFADLERSHQELGVAHARLELAHRQLAEAAQRERGFAVLRERGRLARDMHDTLGHSLVLANVKLEAALRLRAVDAGRADHEIIVTQEILRDSMAELRASLANLRSPLLAQESLGEALARMADEAGARASWEVQTDIAPDVGEELDEPTYETMLRIGSEAITNVERHAHARTLTLSLAREKRCGDAGHDTLLLRITDDGIGIHAASRKVAVAVLAGSLADGEKHENNSVMAQPKSLDVVSPIGHYGITGMRERVAALGGQLTITTLDEAYGTVVEARVPLE